MERVVKASQSRYFGLRQRCCCDRALASCYGSLCTQSIFSLDYHNRRSYFYSLLSHLCETFANVIRSYSGSNSRHEAVETKKATECHAICHGAL